MRILHPLRRFDEGGGLREKLHADQIPDGFIRARNATNMPDPRIYGHILSVQLEVQRLD
jgi:hypothetical protein